MKKILYAHDVRILLTLIFGCLPATLVASFAAPAFLFGGIVNGNLHGPLWGLAATLGTIGLWISLPPIGVGPTSVQRRVTVIIFLLLGICASLPAVSFFPIMLPPILVAFMNLIYFFMPHGSAIRQSPQQNS